MGTPEDTPDDAASPVPVTGRGIFDVDASKPKDGGASVSDARILDAPVPIDARVIDSTVPDAAFDSGSCATVEGPPDGGPLSCAYNLTLVDPLACDFSGPGNTGSPELCARLCGSGVTFCEELVPNGPIVVQCMAGCGGRKPEGLRPARGRGTNALAIYFADAARLEAASVDAFRIVRRELAMHGAPKRLTRAAGRAARDEIRHARVTRAIMRRFGGRAAPVDLARPAARSLEQIAVENAVEGCVNETFGALTAMYQAEHAEDGVVRAAMKRIARDETRHAELAWEIARWLEPRLSPEERVRVRTAREAAIGRLDRAQRIAPPTELQIAAGLPSAERAARMMNTLKSSLWA